jgi:hypothetical protein
MNERGPKLSLEDRETFDRMVDRNSDTSELEPDGTGKVQSGANFQLLDNEMLIART